MDISADLHELTRCPVGLVSAGVKSILDIGRTLEYLETLGVPVLSYAETDDFPAFYSRCSGFKSPWRVDDPTAAARILYAQEKLGMANGVLFGVPIPEQYEAIGGELQTSIEQALQEAEDSGVSRRGKEVTPWLLKRVGELTGGKSLASNVALIENTALVGGQIAVAYAELTREYQENSREEDSSGLILAHKAASIGKTGTSTPRQSLLGDDMPQAKLVVFGSAAVDITAQARSESADPSVGLQSTVPGSVSLTLGGVGRNVAEAAHRTLTSHTGVWQASTLLVSPIGDDPFGYLLVDEMRRIGMRTDGLIQTDGPRSSVCNLVLDSEGSLMGGVADMDIINTLDKDTVLHLLRRHKPVIAALDGNLSQDTLKFLVHHCIRNNIAVFLSVPQRAYFGV
ncbi:hypothetical protein AcV7_000695 [Taiwanofungus camphoratus]|nr:hypothetical protein AcV7_000695 [Antrodia cinnamomea]